MDTLYLILDINFKANNYIWCIFETCLLLVRLFRINANKIGLCNKKCRDVYKIQKFLNILFNNNVVFLSFFNQLLATNSFYEYVEN